MLKHDDAYGMKGESQTCAILNLCFKTVVSRYGVFISEHSLYGKEIKKWF